MEAKDIRLEYNGRVITFVTVGDSWRVEANADMGYKDFPTLSKAKEWIDKRRAQEIKEPFKRFEVYYNKYNTVVLATVTSISDDGEFWISYSERLRGDKKGEQKREKVSAYAGANSVILRTPETEAHFKKYLEAVAAYEKVGAEVNQIRDQFKKFKTAKEFVEEREKENAKVSG